MQLFPLFCLAFLTLARAALVNQTIDDSGQDQVKPVYLPSTAWNKCPGNCFIDLSPDLNTGLVHGGTWHQSLNPNETASTTLTFTGTAVYVYLMLFAYSRTHVTFHMDGENQDGVYTHEAEHDPLKGPTFLYQVLGYSSSSLSNGQHSLVMANGDNSLAAFDYAVYTTEESESASDTSSPGQASPQHQSAQLQASVTTLSVSPGVTTLSANQSATTLSASPSTTTLSARPSVAASSSSLSSITSTVPLAATGTNHTGPIAGGTVAGVVALIAIGAFIYYRYRIRQRKNLPETSQSTQQFISPFSVSEHTSTVSDQTSPYSSPPYLAARAGKTPVTHPSQPLYADSDFGSAHDVPPQYTEV